MPSECDVCEHHEQSHTNGVSSIHVLKAPNEPDRTQMKYLITKTCQARDCTCVTTALRIENRGEN